MRILLIMLSIFGAAAQASASDFLATPTYCNGPVTNGDVSNCPALSSWMGVSLKDLRTVTLPLMTTDASIRIEDSTGNYWEQALATCQSKTSDLRGCQAKVDMTKPKTTIVQIQIWDFNQRMQTLYLTVDDSNQLTIISSQGDQLMFALTAK